MEPAFTPRTKHKVIERYCMRSANAETIGNHRRDSSSRALLSQARERLEEHPHFRGRASVIALEMVGDTIVPSGCLPSHYLKQLLQEALKAVPGVDNVDNQVHVAWPG